MRIYGEWSNHEKYSWWAKGEWRKEKEGKEKGTGAVVGILFGDADQRIIIKEVVSLQVQARLTVAIERRRWRWWWRPPPSFSPFSFCCEEPRKRSRFLCVKRTCNTCTHWFVWLSLRLSINKIRSNPCDWLDEFSYTGPIENSVEKPFVEEVEGHVTLEFLSPPIQSAHNHICRRLEDLIGQPFDSPITPGVFLIFPTQSHPVAIFFFFKSKRKKFLMW